MASEDDTLEADAKRMKSRSFAGYLKDRATGAADFKAPPIAAKSSRAQAGGESSLNKEDKDSVGFKRGGAVKRPSAPKKSCW